MKGKNWLKAISMTIVLLLGTVILSCDKQEDFEPVPQENETALQLKCATCTLTPGYWMTHNNSFKGGASNKADDNWKDIKPAAELTVFYLSGKTYFDVLWTPPKGNVYYILAHAYIGALLNKMAGADFQDANAAFYAAKELFLNHTPDDASGLKGQAKKEWTDLATILDNYNNGIIGPGHCPD